MLLEFKLTDLLTMDNAMAAVISAITTIVVFFLTLLSKTYIETRVLSSKLEKEHEFNQRKRIKEVLSKHKVHLLTACEELNHRMWNFSNNHTNDWLEVKGDYLEKQNYYFQSFIYRFLSLFGWIRIINQDMIYLDTTIATKNDLEFIKFLRLLPRIFSDLTFIEGDEKKGASAEDHFYRNDFEVISGFLIKNGGIISYANYLEDLGELKKEHTSILKYFDGLSPTEQRTRWDRLHMLHLTIVLFLNNYGYDFQKTNKKKLQTILTTPTVSFYLTNYFNFISEYNLAENKEAKRLKRIANKFMS